MMAPLDLMLHVVNLFLRQVHRGLWDGCDSVKNNEHVLMISPGYDDEGDTFNDFYDDVGHSRDDEDGRRGGRTVVRHFRYARLDSASYREYSPVYPHVKYTIGMVGRPFSGPEIYVNKIDNTGVHWRGGC